MSILCRWLGHRWKNDGWWKLDDDGTRWKRHDTCRRCGEELTTTVSGTGRPLDVYAHGARSEREMKLQEIEILSVLYADVGLAPRLIAKVVSANMGAEISEPIVRSWLWNMERARFVTVRNGRTDYWRRLPSR